MKTSNLTLPKTLLLGLFLLGARPADACQVTQQDISKAVVAHVEEAVTTEPGTHVTVEVLMVPGGPFEFPQAGSANEVRIDAQSNLKTAFASRSIIRVHMTSPDGKTRDIGVPVKISVTKPVWVINSPVQAGQPLSPKEFKVENREISQQFQTAAAADQDLANYAARINLKPGQVLDLRQVNMIPAVRQNEDVHVILSDGHGMNITLTATAMDNGQVGQTVRVRHRLYHNKYYTAKVVAPNRVMVEI